MFSISMPYMPLAFRSWPLDKGLVQSEAASQAVSGRSSAPSAPSPMESLLSRFTLPNCALKDLAICCRWALLLFVSTSMMACSLVPAGVHSVSTPTAPKGAEEEGGQLLGGQAVGTRGLESSQT